MFKATVFNPKNSEEPLYINVTGMVETTNHTSFRSFVHCYINRHKQELINGLPLVIDLTDTNFMDCAGLGVLASISKKLRQLNSNQIVHVLATEQPARVLQLAPVIGVVTYKSIREVNNGTDAFFEKMFLEDHRQAI